MALDWAPQGRTFEWVDEDGPHEANVIGLLAYIEGDRFYEIWPIDEKGTDSDGYRLSLSGGADGDEDLGPLGTFDDAKNFAEDHMAKLGLRDAKSAATAPIEKD